MQSNGEVKEKDGMEETLIPFEESIQKAEEHHEQG